MSTPSPSLTTTIVTTESECAPSDANIGWDVKVSMAQCVGRGWGKKGDVCSRISLDSLLEKKKKRAASAATFHPHIPSLCAKKLLPDGARVCNLGGWFCIA